MLQLEVAARLTAVPGTGAYGALTLFWRLWADVALLETVPARAFRPPPRVESAVIRVEFRRSPRVAVADERAFTRVVRAAFGQRRKTLANALRGGGLGGAGVADALRAAGIDPGRRAETLDLEEFARVAAFLGGPESA
jgi:16S rRNA (adenine1518-N6/adenine1519-N6)-dimethyltransferase